MLQMRLYPMLRDEVDRVLTEQIKEQEVRTKEQVIAYLKLKSDYWNDQYLFFINILNVPDTNFDRDRDGLH